MTAGPFRGDGRGAAVPRGWRSKTAEGFDGLIVCSQLLEPAGSTAVVMLRVLRQ